MDMRYARLSKSPDPSMRQQGLLAQSRVEEKAGSTGLFLIPAISDRRLNVQPAAGILRRAMQDADRAPRHERQQPIFR
jgi:hypothetical protein